MHETRCGLLDDLGMSGEPVREATSVPVGLGSPPAWQSHSKGDPGPTGAEGVRATACHSCRGHIDPPEVDVTLRADVSETTDPSNAGQGGTVFGWTWRWP